MVPLLMLLDSLWLSGSFCASCPDSGWQALHLSRGTLQLHGPGPCPALAEACQLDLLFQFITGSLLLATELELE